ncbi:HAD hydrolase-like protein [uncultured Tateyamaria sp.]|uniref:HAD family hydrolase n=1 Tax=uncultured Tateyamaria sp. TaxID=455651 RepID=UPI0026357B71|nr:HAD hydrolase-like protein [uncultured Tateyamaria sp.]
MARYEHVAFDFDGVVADSAAVCADEINRLRAHFPTIPEVHNQDDFAFIYPGPLRTSLRRFGLSDESVRDFFDRHSARMMSRARELKPFVPVAKTLADMDPARFTIVTSSYSATVRDVLSRSMPGVSVDEISILGRELKMKKSAKFQRIMTENNLRPAQLLKIGDMVSDVLYAADAGIDCAAVGWGYHPLRYLKAFDARHFVSSPNELRNLLRKYATIGETYV